MVPKSDTEINVTKIWKLNYNEKLTLKRIMKIIKSVSRFNSKTGIGCSIVVLSNYRKEIEEYIQEIDKKSSATKDPYQALSLLYMKGKCEIALREIKKADTTMAA